MVTTFHLVFTDIVMLKTVMKFRHRMACSEDSSAVMTAVNHRIPSLTGVSQSKHHLEKNLHDVIVFKELVIFNPLISSQHFI